MQKYLIKTNLNKTHIVIGTKSVDRRLLEGSSPLDIKLQLYKLFSIKENRETEMTEVKQGAAA